MFDTPILPKSSLAYGKALRVMPGGNTRTTVYEAPHPLYLASGEGARVVDLDGNRYLDFTNNFTTLIHGHSFAPVVAALEEQIGRGLCFGFPTETEIALAEMLCERVPAIDLVRFANTGSEAVMMAVRAARAYTGRAKIVKCEGCYHGSYDPVEVSVGPQPGEWGRHDPEKVTSSRGIPDGVLDDVLIIPFNDAQAAERILAPAAKNIAAVIVDPCPARLGSLPIDPSFLAFLRRFTHEHGVLLISDEVLTFRLGYHGAIARLDVDADLWTIGKIIGGGLPIGAIAGKAEFMAVFDPSKGRPAVSQSGTFTANPLSMVAGLATLRALSQEAFAELNALGEYARTRLRDMIEALGANAQVTGEGSLFRLHLTKQPLRNYRDTYMGPLQRRQLATIVALARRNGVLIASSGLAALSTPMRRSDIDTMVDVVGEGFRRLVGVEGEQK